MIPVYTLCTFSTYAWVRRLFYGKGTGTLPVPPVVILSVPFDVPARLVQGKMIVRRAPSSAVQRVRKPAAGAGPASAAAPAKEFASQSFTNLFAQMMMTDVVHRFHPFPSGEVLRWFNWLCILPRYGVRPVMSGNRSLFTLSENFQTNARTKFPREVLSQTSAVPFRPDKRSFLSLQ